jgi:hypothetical protein
MCRGKEKVSSQSKRSPRAREFFPKSPSLQYLVMNRTVNGYGHPFASKSMPSANTSGEPSSPYTTSTPDRTKLWSVGVERRESSSLSLAAALSPSLLESSSHLHAESSIILINLIPHWTSTRTAWPARRKGPPLDLFIACFIEVGESILYRPVQPRCALPSSWISGCIPTDTEFLVRHTFCMITSINGC